MSTPNAMPTAESPGDGGLNWAEVLARHDRWLRAVVVARLGERQALDDVMQEISLAAVRMPAPLIEPGKIGAWLYRVAVRTTLIYRRKIGRRRKFEDRFAEAREDKSLDRSVAPDPLEWLLHDEQLELVRKAVGRLPHRDAEILLLKYAENWSYRELADHLGITTAAVEARLHRARGRLRTILGESNNQEVKE